MLNWNEVWLLRTQKIVKNLIFFQKCERIRKNATNCEMVDYTELPKHEVVLLSKNDSYLWSEVVSLSQLGLKLYKIGLLSQK